MVYFSISCTSYIVTIFLLLAQGEYEKKTFSEWVIWSVALQSMIQEPSKVTPNGNSPEYANKQELSFLMRDLAILTSWSLNHPLYQLVHALWCKHQTSSSFL